MSARETAERHAQDVLEGNLSRLMGDFAGSALSEVVAAGRPPQPTTKWEILSEDADGDAVRFRVRCSNATDSLELATRWERFADGAWKVVKVERVGA